VVLARPSLFIEVREKSGVGERRAKGQTREDSSTVFAPPSSSVAIVSCGAFDGAELL
jgi:hypothetical protein